MASATPDLRLPSLLQGITAYWLVPRGCRRIPIKVFVVDVVYADRAAVLSASPSQLRVRVGVDATFVCRIDGQLASSRQLRWSRPIGVTRRQFSQRLGPRGVDPGEVGVLTP